MKNVVSKISVALTFCAVLILGTGCGGHHNNDDDGPTEYCTFKLREPNVTFGNITLVEGDSFCIECAGSSTSCGGPKTGNVTLEAEYNGTTYSVDVEIVTGTCKSCHVALPKFHMTDLQFLQI